MEQQVERKTVFDLERLIKRCFEESEKSGDIKPASGWGDRNSKVLVNSDAVAKHISMTIIGELFELEIVRKIAPMFRQFRSLERDLSYVEERQAADTALLGLRIATPEPKTD